MMAVQQTITKNWQWIVGAGAILISVGVNLSDIRAMKEKLKELENKYIRQYEVFNRVQERIVALEAKEAYRKGREDERAKMPPQTTYQLTP